MDWRADSLKQCPACGKKYKDDWNVCIKDNTKLPDIGNADTLLSEKEFIINKICSQNIDVDLRRFGLGRGRLIRSMLIFKVLCIFTLCVVFAWIFYFHKYEKISVVLMSLGVVALIAALLMKLLLIFLMGEMLGALRFSYRNRISYQIKALMLPMGEFIYPKKALDETAIYTQLSDSDLRRHN
jgi:hypothetical protein